MSRIPVPTHSTRPLSPSPFPTSPDRDRERASSPSPLHFQNNRPHAARSSTLASNTASITAASMSSISGFQSQVSMSETRKKQSKRDEVSSFVEFGGVGFDTLDDVCRQFGRRSSLSSRGSGLSRPRNITNAPLGGVAKLHQRKALSLL